MSNVTKAKLTKVVRVHQISLVKKVALEAKGYTVVLVQDQNKGIPAAPWFHMSKGKVTKY